MLDANANSGPWMFFPRPLWSPAMSEEKRLQKAISSTHDWSAQKPQPQSQKLQPQFNSIQSSIQRHPADGYKNVYPEIKSLSGAASTLQMIRFQLDKIYHPDHLHHNPDYDFNMSKSLGDNCKDVSRAFYDFINNADAKCDRSGN